MTHFQCPYCGTTYSASAVHVCPPGTAKSRSDYGVPTGGVPRSPDSIAVDPIPTGQPAPKPNEHPAVWPLVMVDMASRDQLGRKRYGTPLQPHNGRDTLRDAYEEALDLAVYLRTAIFERDNK